MNLVKKGIPPFGDTLLLTFLPLFLFFCPWYYGLTRFRDQLLVGTFLLSLSFVVLLFLDWSQFFQNRSTRKPIDLWVFLSLGFGLFYMLISYAPYPSFLAYLRLFSWAIFYALVRSLVTTNHRLRFFLWVILVIGFFYSLYGLAQYDGRIPHPYWYSPVLSSRYVNGGHFAALLLFSLFSGIGLLASNRRPLILLVICPLLCVIGWALLLSRSRTVWIAFLIGLGIFAALLSGGRRLNSKGIFFIVLFGTGIGFFFWKQGGLELILGRFRELQTLKFYSLIYRLQLWQGALHAISARPWGWGLGTFSLVFPQFKVHVDRFLVDYAHNEFLQIGVDLGFPGILFVLGFFLVYLRRAAFFLKNKEAGFSQRAMGSSLAALGVSLALASQSDFPMRIYATSFFLATVLALSSYLFDSLEGEVLVSHWNGFRAGSCLLVFLAGILSAFQLFAEFHFEKGQRLEKDFSWEGATTEYQKAVRLAPFFGGYREALGYLYQKKESLSSDRNQKRELLRKAIGAYEETVRLQPYKANSHYVMAELYEKAGNLAKARSEFLRAIALEKKNPVFLLEYGYFALRHSWIEEAIDSFEKFEAIDTFVEGGRAVPCQILEQCAQQTQDYNQLKRLIRDNWRGHSCLGFLLGENGRWDLAKIEFDLATQRARAISDAHSYLQDFSLPVARFYASHNRLEEALKIYKEALERDPQNIEFQRYVVELSEKIRLTNTLGAQ